MVEKYKQQAFVLRLNEREEEAFRDDVVGVGWACCGPDILGLKDNWEEFKNFILAHYPYYESSSRGLGQAAGTLWRFLFEINPGDLMVIPVKGAFRIGEIIPSAKQPDPSVAYYQSEAIDRDFAWRRKIRWVTESPRERKYAKNTLRRRLKARQTCVTATDILDEIQASILRKEEVAFGYELIENIRGKLKVSLVDDINDDQLEDLVVKLVEAGGGSARKLPKNNSKVGDVDVEGIYKCGISRVKIGYQVKQHSSDSQTDTHAVEQLLQRSEIDDYDLCVAVTTAKAFSKQAQELAKTNKVDLVAGDDMIDWVLDVGLMRLTD